MSEIRIECIRDWDELDAYGAAWTRLIDQIDAPSVYQTMAWNAGFRSFYGSGAELRVILAFVDDALVGIAPLVLLRKRVLGRWRTVIQFVSTHHSDCQDWVIHPDYPHVVGHMLTYMLTMDAHWDLWYLLDIPDDSLMLAIASQFLSARGTSWMRRPLYKVSWYLSGDSAQDRKLIGKRNVTRRERLLQSAGHVEIRMASSCEEAHAMTARFVELHVARWRETDTPSIYRNPRERALLHALVEQLFPEGLVELWQLNLDGETIAASIILQKLRRVFRYRVAYSLAHADYSPGRVLLKYTLKHAFEMGATEISFGAGQEAYKQDYCNDIRTTSELRVYRRRLPFLVDTLILKLRATISPFIENSRLLRPLGTWARVKWPDLNT